MQASVRMIQAHNLVALDRIDVHPHCYRFPWFLFSHQFLTKLSRLEKKHDLMQVIWMIENRFGAQLNWRE